MPFYPEMSAIKGLARVTRERRLPPEAVHRHTAVGPGAQVEAVTVVLQGEVLRAYRILDVAGELKLRKAHPDQVANLIAVAPEQRVQFGQELARHGRGRRARVLHSPVDGEIVRVDDGHIIIQVSERVVDVQAKIPGDVESVENDVVRITGVGAIMQCAWGNGRFFFGTYTALPDDGFAGLSKLDPTISPYRGKVIVSTEPVDRGDLLVAQQQEVAGVVAPAMPSSLREFAMQLTFPVVLTEGFGHRRPTALIYRLLMTNMGRQAAFDAALPGRWSWERPEIMIPLPSGGAFPETPSLERPLEVGAQVRLLRAPWEGVIGEVVDIPHTPQVIGNGLRVLSASVRLPDEREVVVPLANLELLG